MATATPRGTLWNSIAAVGIVAAVAVVAIQHYSTPPSAFEALVNASEDLRTRRIQARLSTDFPYREYRVGTSANALDRRDELSVRRVSLALHKAAETNPDAPQKHALGLSYLLVGDPESARVALEAVLKQETRSPNTLAAIRSAANAELLNDLAAAYQTLLAHSAQQEWRAFAVEAVQRAWNLKKSPAIAFTRALALESLYVRESAIAAWTDYLALDRGSAWTREARARLQRLREPTEAELWPGTKNRMLQLRGDPIALRALVNRHRQATRVWCEDELLPQWGESALRGERSSIETLNTVAAIGNALFSANGERDVVDAVQAILRANGRDLQRLARGHAAYGRGRKAIVAVDSGRAVRETRIAVTNLDERTTPFSRRARIEHAAAMYLTTDYARVLSELAALPASPSSNATEGRVEWVRGITHAQMGGPEIAIGHYRRAREAFRRAGEIDYECMIHSLLAWALENGGNRAEADVHRDRAMQILLRTGSSDRRHIVVFEAAYAAIARDTPALADIMLDSVVSHDIASGRSLYACNSLMWRGAYRFRRGLRNAAADDLQLARRFCGSIEDPHARDRATGNLVLAYASLHPGQTTAKDLRDFDKAVQYFTQQKIARWLRTAYLVRGRALAASGATEAAERDFLAALSEVSSIRKQIDARDARVSFTATADDITDAYVEFLLRNGRERDAFEVADGSRSRELVDSPAARWKGEPKASVITRVQQELPPAVALIEYRVMGDTIAVWLLRGKTLSTKLLSRTADDIDVLLQRMNEDATDAELRAAGTELYDSLLQPVAESIGSATSLVIIPDANLEHIPYAALYDSRGGKYLVETHASVIAPSAALYLESTARFRDRAAGEDTMVVIDAASTDADAAALPQAAREAREVAAMFSGARVVSGNHALRTVSEATCLHFSGHGVRQAGDPIRALRLGKGESGRFVPSQIATLSLPITRLVYLSACETDQGPVLRSEGGVTVARSFFAAGVPVVVATLWNVDDVAAREIARHFYERLRSGDSPADALRSAQRTLLRRRTSGRVDWAAFRVLGGGIWSRSPSK